MVQTHKLQADIPRRTLREKWWDFRNQDYFRAKIYLPNWRLDRVLTINITDNASEENVGRFTSQGGAYFFDKTEMIEENGLKKGIFITGISEQITVNNDGSQDILEASPEGAQVAVERFRAPPVTAEKYLQRLQTAWSMEMFKGSGLLNKMVRLLTITMTIAIIGLAVSGIILMYLLGG